MAKTLDELTADLKDEVMPVVDTETLPEFGGFQEPPQPGAYRFRLPTMDKVFELFDTQQGQRLRVIFDRDNPLTILTSSSPATKPGDTFHTRLSNVKRRRGKEGTVEASDLDYLLKALGAKSTPATNKAYIDLLVAASQKEFGGDITYSFVCSPDRNIRVYQDDKLVEVDKKGCAEKGGKTGRYYQKDVPRAADGTYPTEISCQCGAVLRAFANLENLRP